MGEIKDYPCTYGSKEDSVAGLLEKCGLAVPDVYQRADSIGEIGAYRKRRPARSGRVSSL